MRHGNDGREHSLRKHFAFSCSLKEFSSLSLFHGGLRLLSFLLISFPVVSFVFFVFFFRYYVKTYHFLFLLFIAIYFLFVITFFLFLVIERPLVPVRCHAVVSARDGVGLHHAVAVLVSHVLHEELLAFGRRPAARNRGGKGVVFKGDFWMLVLYVGIGVASETSIMMIMKMMMFSVSIIIIACSNHINSIIKIILLFILIVSTIPTTSNITAVVTAMYDIKDNNNHISITFLYNTKKKKKLSPLTISRNTVFHLTNTQRTQIHN